MQARLAREQVNTQGTLARKHARHVTTQGTLACEHVFSMRGTKFSRLHFWRPLDLPLSNCEIELDLLRSRKRIISETGRTPEVPANPDANPRIPPTLTSDATFHINSTKLYVPVVTLSINDNIKFLESLMQGFKRTIFWNKCRSEMTT